jgi:hypothetical protein
MLDMLGKYGMLNSKLRMEDAMSVKLLSRFGLACLLLISCLASANAEIQVGVAAATRKILPDMEAPEATSAQLTVCRDEWESFQLVLTNGTDISDLILSIAVDQDQGENLGDLKVVLYREYYLNVTDESPGSMTYHERGTGLYPDPLIPLIDPYSETPRNVGQPFTVQGGQAMALFVDVYAPEDADAGTFSATLQVRQGDLVLAEIPFSVVVAPVVLPHTVGTAFGYSYNHSRRYHGGPEGEEDPDFVALVDKRYVWAMHEHRMDPSRPSFPSIPFEFGEDGELLPVDWTQYDAAMGPLLDGSYFPDGRPVVRFNFGIFKPGSGLGNFTEDQYIKAARAYAAHLKEKDWWDKAWVYGTDEPWLNGGEETWQRIMADIDRLIQADPDYRYKTLITGSYRDIVGDRVGIWCPVTPMYEDWFYTTGNMAGREEYAERFEKGEDLWFYVCNANLPPYAGYDIDSKVGHEPRIVKWGAYFERASGFLYWRVNYWTQDDTWNVFLNLEEFGDLFSRNGDGFTFYPGDHNGTSAPKGSPEDVSIDGPIVGYRMKQIRDGLEDWELFKLAGTLGAEEYVRAQVSRAYRQFGTFTYESCSDPMFYCPDDQPWTLDENLLLEVRDKVLQKVLFILYPDQYDDPEQPLVDGDADDDQDDESDAIGDGDAELDEDLEEDALPDGDQTLDGDDAADGDEPADGDMTADGDAMADGDIAQNDGGGGCDQTDAPFSWLLLFAFAALASRRCQIGG